MVAAFVIIGVFTVMLISAWIIGRGGRSYLIHAVRTVPARVFPEHADVYVCDKCARDVTKHFPPHQPNTWAPMGPKTFVCRCGQRYLTGAIEWDHLRASERRSRVWQTIWIGTFLSAMFSILGILAYLVLRFLFGLREAGFFVALFIVALPFVSLQITFWPQVLASMWRTRVGQSIEQA